MNRNAPRCILGAVVVAVFLAITWSTTSARLSTTTNTTAVEAAASLDPASPSAGGAILIDSAPNVRLEAIQDPVSQDPVSSSGMSPLAKAAGNLDQARNGSATSPTTPVDWVNGNAGASNSHYREGYSIPYRLLLTNLVPGPHILRIEWDIRNGGKNAIDYITYYDRLNSPNHQVVFGHPAEVINPTFGIAGLAAPFATAIPAPSSAGSTVLNQPGLSFSALSAGDKQMTSYNATGVVLSYVSQGSLSANSSSTQLDISFTTDSPTVLFSWGGHIASQTDWGPGNSASAVSGSPYHTRFISLDGSGGNQDRSLSAAAVIVDCATCAVGADTTAECGTQKIHTATFPDPTKVCDNPQHNWSFVTNTSGASFVGGTTGPSVTVNVGNACSGEYVVRDTITCSGCTTGSTIFCDQKVTVSDTTAPTVATTPPDQTIDCPAPIVFGSPTFSDNCDTNLAVTFVDTTLPFSCPTVNKVRRTWTARDDCNNFVSTSQTITVVDNTAPSIGSPGGNATIQCPATPAFTPPTTASDSCSSTTIIEVSDVTTQGSCAGSYSQTKTWKARDACGNLSGPVSQTITVEDKTAPVISTLPEPTTIQCTATPSFATPTATDACDPSPTLTFADVTTPGSCPQTHDVTRTWTATDHCGNSSTASQTIHVVDTTAPVISTLPEPTTIQCTATPSFATPTATDACDPSPTLTFADVTTPGSCPQARDVTRTWTATDHCDNSSTASQTIHVVDTTAPVISALPEPTTIQCTATPSFATPTATDACDPSPTLTFADVTTPGSCPQARDVTRTWTATDHCGNSSTASQTIHVVDTTAPVISTLPEPTTIECPAAPSFATPTATDACDPSPTLTFADVTTPGSCAHDVTRTWTATDHCGNSSTASQTIHVVDTTAPVLSGCPATEATATCLSDVPPAPTVTASDNCEGNLVVHFEEVTTNKGCNDGACGGIITRTWTAADSCGHSTSCTQMITYGTPGSAQSAQQVAIASLLKSGDLVVGLPGRSLTIPGGDNARASAACLVSKLGASGSTSALPDFGDKTLDSATCQTSPPMDLQEDGTWRNALLSRTITLALNLRLDAQQQLLKQQAQTSGLSSRPDAGFELASLALSSTFWTQGVLPGPDGLVGTSDDELDLSSARMQIMLPTSVLSGLAPGATVADLLKLANAALAGQRTGDVSLSDITAAVDAINRGFDFGRRRLLNSSEK